MQLASTYGPTHQSLYTDHLFGTSLLPSTQSCASCKKQMDLIAHIYAETRKQKHRFLQVYTCMKCDEWSCARIIKEVKPVEDVKKPTKSSLPMQSIASFGAASGSDINELLQLADKLYITPPSTPKRIEKETSGLDGKPNTGAIGLEFYSEPNRKPRKAITQELTVTADDEFQAEAYEPNPQKTFARFSKALERDPSQCLRYERKGNVVWYADECDKDSTTVSFPGRKSGVSVANCECGSARSFEFQLMPRVLMQEWRGTLAYRLGLDFGTVAVYTCDADCVGLCKPECVVVQCDVFHRK